MGAGPLTFNYAMWTARYPEFTGIDEPLASQYFTEATLYVDNTGQGPVTDPNQLMLFLNMATAHIAALNAPKIADQFNSDGVEYNPLVGRITNASEGSVSVATEFANEGEQAAWWNQTKYGAALWRAMAMFRQARYLPSRRRRTFNPPIGRYFGGW